MSDTIENTKGGNVLKVDRFDYYKKKLNSTISVVYSVSIEISNFDLDEFLVKRIKKEERFFNFNNYLLALIHVEKPLLDLYYLYKKNLEVYNKLIENEQKIDKSFF